MPITFDVTVHHAEPIAEFEGQCKTVGKFFEAACYSQRNLSGEMLQTSVTRDKLATLRPKANGFVNTIIEAHDKHHHLRIRPDDVWIAIQSQLSFYVNRNTLKLRKYTVSKDTEEGTRCSVVPHEGKKELRVQTVGSRYTVDLPRLAVQMSNQAQAHEDVVDKTVVERVFPKFTTSTCEEVTVCSTLTVSILQKHFEFTIEINRGIPSVTLEGEKAEWEEIYKRLDPLAELGTEPEQWTIMLRPILRRFVNAFDGNPDITFWEHVVDRKSEARGISGWITAFCVWDADGNWLAPSQTAGTSAAPRNDMASSRSNSHCELGYTLDGALYFSLNERGIPPGYSEVDVLVEDNGKKLNCKMVSGHVASIMSKAVGDSAFNTVRPAPQWFLYVKSR